MEAYVAVTRRILGEKDARRRAALTREVLARARETRASAAATEEDRLAARYLAAVEKMQGAGG